VGRLAVSTAEVAECPRHGQLTEWLIIVGARVIAAASFDRIALGPWFLLSGSHSARIVLPNPCKLVTRQGLEP